MASEGNVVRKKLNKVVLAYSGGLDTSVIVPWLRLGLSLPPSLNCYCYLLVSLFVIVIITAGRTTGVRLFASLQMLAKYVKPI